MNSRSIKIHTARIHSSEEWQMDYMAKMIGVSFQAVSKAKTATGSTDPKEIEEYIRNKS